jgi:hypothetical protein
VEPRKEEEEEEEEEEESLQAIKNFSLLINVLSFAS